MTPVSGSLPVESTVVQDMTLPVMTDYTPFKVEAKDKMQAAADSAYPILSEFLGDGFLHVTLSPSDKFATLPEGRSVEHPTHPYLEWYNLKVHLENGKSFSVGTINLIPDSNELMSVGPDQIVDWIIQLVKPETDRTISIIAMSRFKNVMEVHRGDALERFQGAGFTGLEANANPLHTGYTCELTDTHGFQHVLGTIAISNQILVNNEWIAKARDREAIEYDYKQLLDRIDNMTPPPLPPVPVD